MTSPDRNRRRVALGALALAAGAGGSLLLMQPETDGKLVAAQAARMGDRNGILIAYGNPATFRVGNDDLAAGWIRDGRMTAAALPDVAAALEGMAPSLAIYPPGFFAKLCRAVFICGTLLFGDMPAGGSWGAEWIVLAADPRVGKAGIYETAKLGIHHEFSSLVLQRMPAIARQWMPLLPSGWRPIDRTDDALGRQGERDGSDGFLSAYATTSAENDFNTYAETAFTAPARLRALGAHVVVVKRKTALLIQAYIALDPRMADVFRSLGLVGS